MFVDNATIVIKSGCGGKGCLSFRREKYKPRGGPDGGDGGNGGDVIFVGDSGMNSLVKFRYSPRLFAKNGKHGMGNNRSGRKGQNLIVKVPCGTILRNVDTGEVICEITRAGHPVTIAQGGRGGRGNQHFATSVNQTPRFFENGNPGVEFAAILELKVMADVGLVGLPNAGKSSLVTAVSQATPKIADYPFTTLNPVVGVIELPGYRTMVMADIPGIIEGASQGRGLGIQFLKHVERTKVLLFVVDVSRFANTPPHKALKTLRNEINRFGHGLHKKKFLIAANKIDLDPEHSALSQFISRLNGGFAEKLFPISAVTREGIERLITELDRIVNGQ
jgi:GTP-binding protein